MQYSGTKSNLRVYLKVPGREVAIMMGAQCHRPPPPIPKQNQVSSVQFSLFQS